jgi:hypothetical protein
MLYEQGKQDRGGPRDVPQPGQGRPRRRARDFAQGRREELARYPAFERVKQLEGQINQQVRLIENSSTMTAEQKRVQIMRLNAMKNRAAEGLFNGGASR